MILPERKRFYYRSTEGIRVTVRPRYLAEHSRPERGHYVFQYHVRLENVADQAAQLRARRWMVHDSIGEATEIEGEGVVGEQPVLRPGGIHEYRSFCVLKSPQGFMEGQYRFVRADGTRFEAEIPRFPLVADGAPDLA
jgi:ApaG protein